MAFEEDTLREQLLFAAEQAYEAWKQSVRAGEALTTDPLKNVRLFEASIRRLGLLAELGLLTDSETGDCTFVRQPPLEAVTSAIDDTVAEGVQGLSDPSKKFPVTHIAESSPNE